MYIVYNRQPIIVIIIIITFSSIYYDGVST